MPASSGTPGTAFDAALAHQRAGRLAEAEAAYRQVAETDPAHADACNNLGVLLNAQGRREEALACFERLAAHEPHLPRAQANRGVVLRALGRKAEAIAAYQAALLADRGFHPAHHNLGNLFYESGDFAAALAHYEQASTLQPQSAEYRFLFAKSLIEAGRLDRAEAELRVVLRQEPENADAMGTLARIASERHLLADALAWFDAGVARQPDYAGLIYNRALARFLAGDLAGGFADYERRFEVPAFPGKRIPTDKPFWDGTPDGALTLLVHAEQGLGDSLQFARYLPEAARRVGRVLFLVQKPLEALFDMPPGVQVVAEGQPVPAFDRVCALLSLPYLLARGGAVDIPAAPYLTASGAGQPLPGSGEEPATPLEALVPDLGTRLRIGLVWGGNPAHQNDLKRSIPLAQFQPLLALEGVAWFSLQIGPRSQEISTLGVQDRLVDLAPGIHGFQDTATRLQELDLLVCVDTSVAHLAGGLGLPVWLLLPWLPDWRWQLHRDDTPWYPAMKLWRQTRPNDWSGVLAQLGEALKTQAQLRQRVGTVASKQARLAALALMEEGKALLERREYDLAATLFWRGLRDAPGHAQLANAVAVAAFRRNQPRLAAIYGARACRQEPEEAENHANLGAYRRACRDIAGALASFDAGLGLRKDYPGLIYNRGLVKLMAGHLAGGFADYERRFDVADFPSKRVKTDKPLWDGSPLPGKTLLIHAEQGLGDSLQFVRYLLEVAGRVGQVLLMIQASLKPVLRLPANVLLLEDGQAIPPFDACCALLSLPWLLAADPVQIAAAIPAHPYLRLPPARPWTDSARQGQGGGLRVGLVWAGNPGHNNDANRSIPLPAWQQLLALPGVQWCSLQMGPRKEDFAALGWQDRLLDCSADIRDFADTAAWLRNLDLLVCVDTSIAHLAGAWGCRSGCCCPMSPTGAGS